MYETLQRPLDVSQIPTLPSVRVAVEKLKQSERRREEKRHRQIAMNKAKLAAAAAGGIKRKRDKGERDRPEGAPDSEAAVVDESNAFNDAIGDDIAGARTKKLKIADISGEDEHMSDQVDNDEASTLVDSLHHILPSSAPSTKISISKAFSEVRGHTSYLTFASLLPSLSVAGSSSAVSLPSLERGLTNS